MFGEFSKFIKGVPRSVLVSQREIVSAPTVFCSEIFYTCTRQMYALCRPTRVKKKQYIFPYMSLQGYCDKRTGKLLDIHLSNYTRILPSVEVINIYETPLFFTSQNQLYCNDQNGWSRISLKSVVAVDRSAADTVVQVSVGIDNKNPMAAYCSTDRIVIGSA